MAIAIQPTFQEFSTLIGVVVDDELATKRPDVHLDPVALRRLGQVLDLIAAMRNDEQWNLLRCYLTWCLDPAG